MNESEPDRVISPVRRMARRAVHCVFRRLPHRWLQVMMVLAMTAGSPSAHVQQVYGLDGVDQWLRETILAVLSYNSNPKGLTKEQCKEILEDAKSIPFTNPFGFLLLPREEDIQSCKAILSSPDPSGPSTQAANMRYPNYIAANQAGTRLYTANFDSTVSTFDVASGAPIGTIQFPSNLDGGDTDYSLGDIAINPMGTRLYVLNTIYETTLPVYTLLGQTLEVIDTESNAVIASVPLGFESQPSDVVVHPAGDRVYVTTSDIKIHDTGQVQFLDSGKVYVIDAGSNTILKSIAFSGQAPGPLVAHPDGSHVYVGVPRYSFFSDATQAFVSVPARVSVISTSQNTVIKTIDLEGGSPRRLAINPTGTRLYVAHWRDDSFLEVIDTARDQVITRIDIPVDFPVIGDIQVTADGAYLFMTVDLSTGGPDLIYIFDTMTNTIFSTIELPPDTQPGRMAFFTEVNDGQVPLSNFSSPSLILQTPVIQVPGAGNIMRPLC